MASTDWTELTNSLSSGVLARGVTAGETPPNGGGTHTNRLFRSVCVICFAFGPFLLYSKRLAREADRLPRWLERGAPALPFAGCVGGLAAALKLVLSDVIAARTIRSHEANTACRLGFELHARRLINRLAHIMRLRESTSIGPCGHPAKLRLFQKFEESLGLAMATVTL